jgi:membrane protein implicated in regulation of membrane protease activity
MQWWAWIAVGAILFGSELAFVNAQFYLMFVGASAIAVGLLDLAGFAIADWLQWSVFAVLAVVSMVAFRRRVYERLRRTLPTMRHGPAGETVIMPTALQPGDTCRLEFRGTSWSAMNAGSSVIGEGARARIARVDGLTLIVHSDA